MSQISDLVRYQQRFDVASLEFASMWKSVCYRSLLLVLLLPGTASATVPPPVVIPLLGDWSLGGIALALAIAAAISKRRRK